MASSTRSASWLTRLWPGRGSPGPSAPPGAPQRVGDALLALEGLLADALVHAVAPQRDLERTLRRIPSLNLFRRPLEHAHVGDAAGRVARATGMALAGQRATAFLGDAELLSACEALRSCASRHVPLVVHADLGNDGHEALAAVAGTGCVAIAASSGQAALDWTVLARWLTERALVPVLLAAPHDGIESVAFLDDAPLAELLGHPEELVASASEAQRILLGAERPRVSAWFDVDRPVATGGPRPLAGEAARDRAEHAYFWQALPDLVREGIEILEPLTGRRLGECEAHGLEDAEIVLVGQGTTVQVARAVAARLRRERGPKVGVLGISLLRPLPVEALSSLLAGRRAVAVIECSSIASEAPLLRELAVVAGRDAGWVSALSGRGGPPPQALAALCALLRTEARPERVQLERLLEPRPTGFPRRDVLLEATARTHPELSRSPLPDVEEAAADPPGGRAVGFVAREGAPEPDAVLRVAEMLHEEQGGFVRGWDLRPAPGIRAACLRTAPDAFADPGPRAPVSLLWIADAEIAAPPFDLLPPAAAAGILVVSTADPGRLWTTLGPAWRRNVRESELRLFACPRDFDGGLEALRALLRAEDDPRLREIPWRELPEHEAGERVIPQLVRRLSHLRETHDSLPRFWGEALQPRREGASDGWPDPLTAVGVVPALASALAAEPATTPLAVLDASACTGCGRCWSACPDSAIGVTALGAETLLTAASRSAGTEGTAADAVRRAHKHWAGRIASELAKSEARTLEPVTLTGSWDWVRGRLNVPEAEDAAYAEAANATVAALGHLEPIATGPLWHEAEKEKKGAGALLVLAIDPRACVGCGLCVAVCPENALACETRTPDRVAAHRRRWQAWEELPDTPGEILARAGARPEPGPLAATLLSRHSAQSQVAGGCGEPGSGERLATRLVTAFVEAHGQRQNAALLEALGTQRSRLDHEARERLGAALNAPTLEVLGEAVAGLRRGRADLGELVEGLDRLGAPARFDRSAVLRLTRAAAQLEQSAERLARGQDGLGRSRFGVVVAGARTAQWAARFPGHPFFAPLTVAASAEGAELARGIAQALTARHVALVRAMRGAALELEAPPDRTERLEALHALRWSDLAREERIGCPPLLLLGDEDGLVDRGIELVMRLLDTDLPVKVVLLDGRGRIDAAAEPALLAMAHRRAFVLAASLAHPDHLARGLRDGLAWPGPALFHLHAPSPERHGFPVEAMLDRARLAVEARAHILLRYDPEAEGVFGVRSTLDGNPQPEADWGDLDFAGWAAGEARFAHCFTPIDDGRGVSLADWLAQPQSARRGPPTVEHGGRRLAIDPALARAAEERRAIWQTLRELTGAAGPFTDRIRAAVADELAQTHRAEIEARERDHAARLAEARALADEEALRRLTDRLLALSGFAPIEAGKVEP